MRDVHNMYELIHTSIGASSQYLVTSERRTVRDSDSVVFAVPGGGRGRHLRGLKSRSLNVEH